MYRNVGCYKLKETNHNIQVLFIILFQSEFVENTNVREVLEVLVVVESVAHQHLVRHPEADIVRSVGLHSTSLL